jgi:hypothetical protein
MNIIAPMMKAASTSETSVSFYQTTRRYTPEDSHFAVIGWQVNEFVCNVDSVSEVMSWFAM